METNRICVLITFYNRKEKTIRCLKSLFLANAPSNIEISVILLDDGSNDGTASIIKEIFPKVNIIQGDGNFFWAGGMRFIWNRAISENYDFYLLLNDDTTVSKDVFSQLIECHNYSVKEFNQAGLYIGSTKDSDLGKFSYGGRRFVNSITPHFKIVYPNKTKPQQIDLGNANIMMVPRVVVDKIGIFSSAFTHGIADYEYTFRARKNKIPVLITTDYCGECINDHGVNWRPQNSTLKERISYLKSHKGLAYREYLFFIFKVRPIYLPISFLLLWTKTLLPVFWNKFKKNEY